jgi:hypothetical protein
MNQKTCHFKKGTDVLVDGSFKTTIRKEPFTGFDGKFYVLVVGISLQVEIERITPCFMNPV